MKTKFALLLLLTSTTLTAQRFSELQVHSDQLRLNLVADGSWNHATLPFAEWLTEDGTYAPLVQDGGFWIGGRDPSGVLEMISIDGRDSVGGAPLVINQLEGFYKVAKSDIEQHIADFFDDGMVDNQDPTIYGWPGKGNPHFNTIHGEPLPIDLTNTASFFDYNLDNIYDPDDGDFPSIRSGSHAADFSELYWYTFSVANSIKLNFDVGVHLLTLDCPTGINDENIAYVGLFYDFITANAEDLIHCALGFSVIDGLGDSEDNYVGIDTTSIGFSTAYMYNAQPSDAVLGDNPPAVGLHLSRGPWLYVFDDDGNQVGQYQSASFTNFLPLFPSATEVPFITPPSSAQQARYDMLFSVWGDGRPLYYGGDGYDEDNFLARYAYPDYPNDPNGWSELQNQNPAGRRGFLASIADFELRRVKEGNVVHQQFALAISATGRAEDHLSQVNLLRGHADTIFSTMYPALPGFYEPICPDEPNSTTDLISEASISLYPNPVDTEFRFSGALNQQRGTMVIYNTRGQEVLVNKEANFMESTNVDFLPSGVYFARIIRSGQQIAIRFVKR
ncbi:MAG: T9SS type A sorting domain-containing protein [Bacteroidota bacterium]